MTKELLIILKWPCKWPRLFTTPELRQSCLNENIITHQVNRASASVNLPRLGMVGWVCPGVSGWMVGPGFTFRGKRTPGRTTRRGYERAGGREGQIEGENE